MKIYSSAFAPSPRKVLIFIAEKGIENIEVINLDIAKMEHKTPEYKKIAPNSRIPALVLDNGDVILETTAICRYLECLHPNPNLFGETPEEIAISSGVSPNKLGLGCKHSRYLHIAVVSSITSPLSNTRAGMREFGAIFLYSGVLCSIFAISRFMTSIFSIPFSAINIKTFLGLGAKALEYIFKCYSQFKAPPT